MHYLEAHGFLAGQIASVIYKSDRITLGPCNEQPEKKTKTHASKNQYPIKKKPFLLFPGSFSCLDNS